MGLSGKYSTDIMADITNIYTRAPLVVVYSHRGTVVVARIHKGGPCIRMCIEEGPLYLVHDFIILNSNGSFSQPIHYAKYHSFLP